MSGRMDPAEKKKLDERHQRILKKLLNEDANKFCADCGAKGPRWASWNLGSFLCIRCAGIHRNLGVHISRVKSTTLDSWTPEQIETFQAKGGNEQVNALYEANLPSHFRRPVSDYDAEQFIRAKYERKEYVSGRGRGGRHDRRSDEEENAVESEYRRTRKPYTSRVGGSSHRRTSPDRSVSPQNSRSGGGRYRDDFEEQSISQDARKHTSRYDEPRRTGHSRHDDVQRSSSSRYGESNRSTSRYDDDRRSASYNYDLDEDHSFSRRHGDDRRSNRYEERSTASSRYRDDRRRGVLEQQDDDRQGRHSKGHEDRYSNKDKKTPTKAATDLLALDTPEQQSSGTAEDLAEGVAGMSVQDSNKSKFDILSLYSTAPTGSAAGMVSMGSMPGMGSVPAMGGVASAINPAGMPAMPSFAQGGQMPNLLMGMPNSASTVPSTMGGIPGLTAMQGNLPSTAGMAGHPPGMVPGMMPGMMPMMPGAVGTTPMTATTHATFGSASMGQNVAYSVPIFMNMPGQLPTSNTTGGAAKASEPW